MSLRRFTSFGHYAAIALTLTLAIASPIAGPSAEVDVSHLQERSDLDVVLTTTTPSGQVIDWIPIGSQGQIVLPPTSFLDGGVPFTGVGAQSELLLPGVTLGPPGTVPVPRMSKEYLANPPFKGGPPLPQSSTKRALEQRDGYAGTHWYVNSGQSITNYGSQASFSLFKAYTQGTCDMSLIQTALAQTNAQMPGNPSQTTMQTVEAGWVALPCQVSQPHLFTYYTINGYQTQGDNIGGWNRDYKGWVQVSSTYYPGLVLTPTSTIGGNQSEVQLTYQLYQGNWYLSIAGPNIQYQLMGYYPGTLFSNNTKTGSLTLTNSSNYAAFYGEIAQAETAITTTDMGSGKFGTAGYGQAAYMHNMYYVDNANTLHDYTATFGDSNSTNWNHGNGAAGGSNWGQYIYVGGPGAGGVVGS